MTNKKLIIIPTFNERDNIGALISKIIPQGFNVLVVDDNSPDGTAQEVEKLTSQYDGALHLMLRKEGKGGRGSATLDGFRWALERGYELVFEMDADFSHDPTELPRFLEASQNADVVIGSRYLPGSEIHNWPLRRRIFSRLANCLANQVLRLGLSDYTNGYRCYSRSALEKLKPDQIPEKGYIVLSYISGQLAAAGCRFAQVPTKFVNRRRGDSQVTSGEIFGALRGILMLRRYVKNL